MDLTGLAIPRQVPKLWLLDGQATTSPLLLHDYDEARLHLFLVAKEEGKLAKEMSEEERGKRAVEFP